MVYKYWLLITFSIDGLVQERRNFGVLPMELRLSFTNPSIDSITFQIPKLC